MTRWYSRRSTSWHEMERHGHGVSAMPLYHTEADYTALGRKRQAAGAPVVNAVLQDVANKLAAVDSQKLKRALDAIQ